MISNPVPWPDGARCAVAITFDMDADSLIHLEHPTDGHNRVSALSMLRYGPEVAVPRILETYRRFGIKQTFFVPAWCIEQYQETVEAMVEAGHEVAHHGYIHENPQGQDRQGEARIKALRDPPQPLGPAVGAAAAPGAITEVWPAAFGPAAGT